jgi:hypothetical protein
VLKNDAILESNLTVLLIKRTHAKCAHSPFCYKPHKWDKVTPTGCSEHFKILAPRADWNNDWGKSGLHHIKVHDEPRASSVAVHPWVDVHLMLDYGIMDLN